jgi:two-component system KDP operon response regulator KdpE
MARILVIDDDPSILDALATELRAEGHDVASAANGEEGLAAASRGSFDLVLTDLAMPVVDGFAVIQGLRRSSAIPIIVLSVREQETDKVRALDLGADDYVTKPFSLTELLARVRAQLRRAPGRGSESVLRFPDLVIDLERRRVLRQDVDVHLTPTEFALLELFARRAGRPLTHQQLIARVWKGASGTTADTVRVHVGTLRRKLEPDPSNPRFIVTEPWVGYRFIAEPI